MARFSDCLPWLVPFPASSTGHPVEAKHNKATTTSHHLRFLLFIAITPFEQRSPSEPRPRGVQRCNVHRCSPGSQQGPKAPSHLFSFSAKLQLFQLCVCSQLHISEIREFWHPTLMPLVSRFSKPGIPRKAGVRSQVSGKATLRSFVVETSFQANAGAGRHGVLSSRFSVLSSQKRPPGRKMAARRTGGLVESQGSLLPAKRGSRWPRSLQNRMEKCLIEGRVLQARD